MCLRKKRRNAFTLVELIIVIVILAILAVVAVPRIIGSASDANEAAVRSNLTTIRQALELFAVQHGGKYPAALADGGDAVGSTNAFVQQLTRYSKLDGSTSLNKDPAFTRGPYVLKALPSITVGPLAGTNDVKVVSDVAPLTPDGTPSEAWKYSYETGEIIANTDRTASDGSAFNTW